MSKLSSNSSALDSSSIYVKSVPGVGEGVFATKEIPAKTVILRFLGERTPVESISDFTHYLELGDGFFLSPSGDVDDLVNHSCDPNCAVYYEGGEAFLKSIRAIAPDEELSFDYSLVMNMDSSRFNCSCGAKNCRGEVAGYCSLSPEVKNRYLAKNLVPSWQLS